MRSTLDVVVGLRYSSASTPSCTTTISLAMRHWRMRDKGQLDIIGIIFHEENSGISHDIHLSGALFYERGDRRRFMGAGRPSWRVGVHA